MGYHKCGWMLGLSLAAGMGLAGQAQAAVDFQITEIYVGISGDDGTPDWIEITNFGDTAGDTSTLWYDDESAAVADGVQLPSVTLNPGQSGVFIVTGDAEASSMTDFQNIWGVSAAGFASGGGGLSQGGDTAVILLSDDTVVDAVTFASISGLQTIEDITGSGPVVLSQAGVNGAYVSNPFFNDSIGDVNDEITLVGSPGVVPEPTSLALLSLGGMMVLKRRRH